MVFLETLQLFDVTEKVEQGFPNPLLFVHLLGNRFRWLVHSRKIGLLNGWCLYRSLLKTAKGNRVVNRHLLGCG